MNHKRILKIRIPRAKYALVNGDNKKVTIDTFCYKVQFSEIYFNCEMYASVELKAYAMNYFKIIPHSDSHSHKSVLLGKNNLTSNEFYEINSRSSIRITSQFKNFEYKTCESEGKNCRKNNFRLDLREYKGSVGYPNSGAYIFYPSTPMKYEYLDPLGAEVIKGNQVTQVRIYSNTALMIMRFYERGKHFTQDSIEIETFVRSIDHSFTPSEITLVARDFHLDNDKTFYTDSNGIEVEKRVFKRGKNGDDNEDVTANYYPVNSFIYIEDVKNKHRMMYLLLNLI